MYAGISRQAKLVDSCRLFLRRLSTEGDCGFFSNPVCVQWSGFTESEVREFFYREFSSSSSAARLEFTQRDFSIAPLVVNFTEPDLFNPVVMLTRIFALRIEGGKILTELKNCRTHVPLRHPLQFAPNLGDGPIHLRSLQSARTLRSSHAILAESGDS